MQICFSLSWRNTLQNPRQCYISTLSHDAKSWAERNKDILLSRKAKDLTFGSLAEGFFDRGSPWEIDQQEHGWTRTDSTLYIYNIFLQHHFLPTWQNRNIQTITASEINIAVKSFKKVPEKLKERERGKGPVPYSLASRNKMLYAFGLMFSYWMQERIALDNPVAAVARFNAAPENPREAIPDTIRKKLRPDTHEEAVALYGETVFTAFFFLLDDTGARPGELRARR